MLLDDVQDLLRLRRYSPRTERTYLLWIRRFILFHGKRHPAELGQAEIREFLNHVAAKQAPNTQRLALAAVLFLYRQVLNLEIADDFALEARPRAITRRTPTVLAAAEVAALLGHMAGTPRLMAEVIYGSGVRLRECLCLRVADLNFEYSQISVVDGKGQKSRLTLLPQVLVPKLRAHLERLSALHRADLVQGFGAVVLPSSYYAKNPAAATDFRWQFLFPSKALNLDTRSGLRGRWHASPRVLQRSIATAAVAAGIRKRVGPHTLRHCFATHMLETGTNIRRLQKLMGHKKLKTTLLYAHVLEVCEGLISPLDRLPE